jgi:hypothetical protein
MTSPSFTAQLARQHNSTLRAEADEHRLARSVRAPRRTTLPRRHRSWWPQAFVPPFRHVAA